MRGKSPSAVLIFTQDSPRSSATGDATSHRKPRRKRTEALPLSRLERCLHRKDVDLILGSLTPAVLVAQADLALHAFHKDLTTKWLGHQGSFFYASCPAMSTMRNDMIGKCGSPRDALSAPQCGSVSPPMRCEHVVHRWHAVDVVHFLLFAATRLEEVEHDPWRSQRAIGPQRR